MSSSLYVDYEAEERFDRHQIEMERREKAIISDFKKKLWRDAQGDDLPEIDREVIAIIQDWDDAGIYKVVFAHRPDPKGWNGKSLSTREVSHYEPKIYDKGGWNIPDVKYWLDLDLPEDLE